MLTRPKYWKYRVLYVGRDLALLAFLKDALKPLDCYVVSCPRGTEARIFIENEKPMIGGSKIKYSLFLFDVQLSDMTGAELAQFTRAVTHRKKTPILIVERAEDFHSLVETIVHTLEGKPIRSR
jgi:DNA-binding response OmpR family regulator